MDYSEELLLMDRVVQLRRLQSHAVKRNQSSSLPGKPKAQDSTCLMITSVGGQEYLVIADIIMVYGCKTVSSKHKGFDGIKSGLVPRIPCWKYGIGGFVG
jgi:hypothetical protein